MKACQKYVPLALFLLVAYVMPAQREETLFDNGGLRISGIWGGAHHNFTAYEEDFHLIRGGYIGMELNRTAFAGWSWNHLKEEVKWGDGNDRFDLTYNGFYLSITPNSRKAVHPKISTLFGSGKSWLNNSGTDKIGVLQPSAGLEINITQWFRLGLEGGYRFVTNADISGLTNKDLSAPFALLDLRFGLSWGR